jgi:hypothetical protein
MALACDLNVFNGVYRLILTMVEDTLGQDMKRDAIVLVGSIYRANKAGSKTEEPEALLDDVEILNLEVRLCADRKILSIKKQAELALLMDGIGRQIAGWRNTGLS